MSLSGGRYTIISTKLDASNRVVTADANEPSGPTLKPVPSNDSTQKWIIHPDTERSSLYQIQSLNADTAPGQYLVPDSRGTSIVYCDAEAFVWNIVRVAVAELPNTYYYRISSATTTPNLCWHSDGNCLTLQPLPQPQPQIDNTQPTPIISILGGIGWEIA